MIALLGSFGSIPAIEIPPPVLREFRGVWVATVGNINWPSRPGLTSGQQQQEIIAILNQASRSHLNAVVLQVRPSGDAFYESSLEPWSHYLTGHMGRPPAPYYDPLHFAIRQAHALGLELHAWINPYRASIRSGKIPLAKNHFALLHPECVRTYGNYLWMDPGEPEVQNHVANIVVDLVKRYDLDGIHLDDYFYPYPEKASDKTVLEFPDGKTFSTYRAKGGKLGRSDWRRQNVDQLVERLHREIKRLKPELRFGISPFGIWRPGFPPQIRGLDAYEEIYADARLWLREGWVDYMSPQLYWGFDNPAQDFGALHTWWLSQNPKNRHIWPGLNTIKVGQTWKADVIARQINYTRQAGANPGTILWNIGTIQRNKGNLSTLIAQKIYTQPALPPAMTWINTPPPPSPTMQLSSLADNRWKLHWSLATNQTSAHWVLQNRRGKLWTTEILPSNNTARVFSDRQQVPDAMVLYSVNRAGQMSKPTTLYPSPRTAFRP